MSYSDSFTFRHLRSTRQKLDGLMPMLMETVEIVPNYSISQWRMARTTAWACNRELNTSALAEDLQQSLDRIIGHVRMIAETFLIDSQRTIDQATQDRLSNEILLCGVLTEKIRPLIDPGENWPPSPASPGMGTNGDRERAEQMIEQIRAEVKRYNVISGRQNVRGRH